MHTLQFEWELNVIKGRLQAEEDRDLARKVIVQLQEEIWSLKKGRMVS